MQAALAVLCLFLFNILQINLRINAPTVANLNFRYIMLEQKKAEDFGITEDDVSEIRQDINKFRFELLGMIYKSMMHKLRSY